LKTLFFSILFTSYVFSNISVLVSNNNKLSNITQKDLANLYLKKTNHINGVKLVPIDNTNQKLFQEFYQKIVKKTPEQLHAYWMKQIYHGTVRPPKKLSSGALKNAMKQNTHIIGYDKDPKTGKILLTIH